MAKTDHMGRPVVVVTGMGVVTSLGAGREDNWRKLTAGESGIREITRFSTEGLKTRIAGTIDFVPLEQHFLSGTLRTSCRDGGGGSHRQSSIGSRGDFPGPLFIAVAPIEIEWEQREELVRASGANDGLGYADLWRAGETGNFHAPLRALPVRLGCRTASRTASAPKARRSRSRPPARPARSAIQLGVEAIRRGETERRSVHRHRRLGECRVADPLLAPLRTLDQQRPAARGLAPVLEGSRRLRHGGRRRRARAGKPGSRAGARRENPRRAGRLRRDGRQLPPHALQPRRQADHRLHAQRAARRRADARRHRLHQCRTAPSTPENDKNEYLERLDGVRRTRARAFRSRRTSR